MNESVFLADLVYKDEGYIYGKLVDRQFENHHWIDNKHTDTQVLLCTKGDQLFVTFRGTEFTNIKDWLTNVDCRFIDGMHRGFHDDVMSVYSEIADYILKICTSRPYKIIPGGHSQGAGDAGIFAIKFKNFHAAYLPGGPRFCDITTANNFKGNIHRIINNNDIVTRIPPRQWGYKHITNANIHYFMEDGTYVLGGLTPWNAFKDRMNGRIQDIGEWGSDGIKDHNSSYYVELWEGRNE